MLKFEILILVEAMRTVRFSRRSNCNEKKRKKKKKKKKKKKRKGQCKKSQWGNSGRFPYRLFNTPFF